MSIPRFTAALALFLAVGTGTFALPSHAWDLDVTRWLQRAAPGPDLPAAIFVFLGDAEVLIPAVALAAVLLWRRAPARAWTAVWLACGLTAVSLLALALKFTIPHPGPPPEFQRAVQRVGLSVQQPYSFPSGHTTRTTFFAIAALGRTPAAGAALIVVMMAALVYIGDHWTSDVLGGLCLGWACAEAARLVRPRG
ncbi:MAG TPA: phosphatase PAP2 family protein [bacterium]|nr:phosphatase PAP2 family protein [bacterium]